MTLKNFRYVWIVGLIFTGVLIILPVILLTTPEETQADSPWDHVEEERPHTDHSGLIEGPLATGSDVTRQCLTCHPDAGEDMLHSVHWTWRGEPVEVEGRDEPVSIGKANMLNNFCIGIQSNWEGCTRCHAGYGWDDADFDFSNQENIDCLACHDQSGTYVKATAGQVAEGVDLVAVAESVGSPTRENCGTCHFNGGGGDAVKHGDLDETLYFPSENLDVHMGRYDFQCIDCHKTEDHEIAGRSISVSYDNTNQVYCTDCHTSDLHDDERLNAHTETVACQTCHIPAGARESATKMVWDWSTAGQDIPENPHEYLKIKGSFIYEDNFIPTYAWYNGAVDHYLLGDLIDPSEITVLNPLDGDINDPTAKIFPFKVHNAKQIYDSVFNYLIQPMTGGEGGYWDTFDWNEAAQLGMDTIGLPYSGNYDFAQTQMYWPITHMVAPAADALQCTDCHGENSRMDWEALGYDGDPMLWGGRNE